MRGSVEDNVRTVCVTLPVPRCLVINPFEKTPAHQSARNQSAAHQHHNLGPEAQLRPLSLIIQTYARNPIYIPKDPSSVFFIYRATK